MSRKEDFTEKREVYRVYATPEEKEAEGGMLRVFMEDGGVFYPIYAEIDVTNYSPAMDVDDVHIYGYYQPEDIKQPSEYSKLIVILYSGQFSVGQLQRGKITLKDILQAEWYNVERRKV